MGKLEDALTGGGFPSTMPEAPSLTVPQQMAGGGTAARS